MIQNSAKQNTVKQNSMKNINSNTNRQIESLIGQLTLDEKIAMIHGSELFRTGAVPRLGIPALVFSDGPMGVRQDFRPDGWTSADGSKKPTSYLPSGSALAATWDPDIIEMAGLVLGEETRARGKDVILGPSLNIKRTPLCGRNFEYMSEDPLLAGTAASAMIRGIQSAGTAACPKHFALNSQETERLWVNVEIDDRALYEIYLPAFRAALEEGGALTLMGSYNLYRGQHLCESRNLTEKVVRNEWNWDGLIVSDWGGTHHAVPAGLGPLDVDMSVTPDFDDYPMAEPLKAAVKAGKVPESAVDLKISHILKLMLRLGKIALDSNEDGETTVAKGLRPAGSLNTPQHQMLLLEAAREAVVLLKNEDSILPVLPGSCERILVVGAGADRTHSNGGGSAEVAALYEITPLDGLRNILGGACQVDWLPGCEAGADKAQDASWQEKSLETSEGRDRSVDEATKLRRKELREAAAAAAADYDRVIFIGGLDHDYDLEGQDRDSIELPYGQDELICALLDANPNTAVILVSGSPVSMEAWADRAKAVVWCSYAGMKGGNALAEVLTGEVDPSGKLPETFPRSLEETPAAVFGDFPGRPLTDAEHARMDAHLTQTYREGIFVGYRYYDRFDAPVRFSFGHGLSYTDFEYLEASTMTGPDGLPTSLWVTVKNTGGRPGTEIVQVYAGKASPDEEDPVRELAAFGRIELYPGETGSITLKIPAAAFMQFDPKAHAFVRTVPDHILSIGSSSRDIRLSIPVSAEADKIHKTNGEENV